MAIIPVTFVSVRFLNIADVGIFTSSDHYLFAHSNFPRGHRYPRASSRGSRMEFSEYL